MTSPFSFGGVMYYLLQFRGSTSRQNWKTRHITQKPIEAINHLFTNPTKANLEELKSLEDGSFLFAEDESSSLLRIKACESKPQKNHI